MIRPYIKLIGVLFVVLITVFCFSLVTLAIVPSMIASSIGVIIGLLIIGFFYGWISIPSIVATVCYIPSLAFFWALINNADYINFMNHWLQDDSYFVNYSVFLSLISLSSTFAVLLIFMRRPFAPKVILGTPSTFLSEPLFIVSTCLAGFFFWLTDPGGTIFTTSYGDLLEQRYEGTQYAGALGLIFWLFAYMTYLSAVEQGSSPRFRRIFLGRNIFLVVTVFSISWLLLHARRNELAGMFILMLLVMTEKKKVKFAGIYLCVTLALLIVVEKVRNITILAFLSDGLELSPDIAVAALPGGASNVFMSFLDVIHYFSNHDFLYGETFVNYLFQLLPTNIYLFFEISKPSFFADSGIFDDYAWNGGINGMSIFYANFGPIGSVFYGVLVGVYITASIKALRSSQLAVKVIGGYLVAIVLRGFWYEFITIIKPVLFLLLIHVVLYSSSHRRFSKV